MNVVAAPDESSVRTVDRPVQIDENILFLLEVGPEHLAALQDQALRGGKPVIILEGI